MAVIANLTPCLAKSKLNFFLYQLLVYLIIKNYFMAKNTSVLLGEHFEKFISRKVSSGKYGSASEVVRTALRILEFEEEKKSALIKALIKGEKSKRVENFDPKAHLTQLHKKYL